MTINLNGRIDSEMFNQLLQAKNSIQEGEDLDIYLCSTGGEYEVMEAILYAINCMVNSYHISIIGYGQLFSCGFELFFRAKCPRVLCGTVTGMYHMASCTVSMSEIWTPVYTADIAKKEYIKSVHKNTIALCDKLGITKGEVRRIKAAHDVYFHDGRMREFLEKSLT